MWIFYQQTTKMKMSLGDLFFNWIQSNDEEYLFLFFLSGFPCSGRIYFLVVNTSGFFKLYWPFCITCAFVDQLKPDKVD